MSVIAQQCSTTLERCCFMLQLASNIGLTMASVKNAVDNPPALP